MLDFKLGYSPADQGVDSIRIPSNKFSCYKRCFLSMLIFTIISLILFFTMIFLYVKLTNKPTICTTKECLYVAKDFKFSMDLSADPCDNFYKYTCGKWNTEHANHKWYLAYSAYTVIEEKISLKLMEFFESAPSKNEPQFVQKARNLYQSCIDKDAIEKAGLSVVTEILEEFNLPRLPRLLSENETMTNETFNWLETEAKIKKALGLDTIMRLIISPNIYNTTENVIYITSPGAETPLSSLRKTTLQINNIVNKLKTSNETSDEEEIDEETRTNSLVLKALFKKVVSQLMKNETDETSNKVLIKTASEILNNVTQTIVKMTKEYGVKEGTDDDFISKPLIQLQNITDENLLKKINKTYPELFSKFIQYMFEDTSIEFSPEKDLIYFHSKEEKYFSEVFSYLLELPDSHIELYMWWQTVHNMLPKVSSDASTLLKALYQSSITTPRSLDCVNEVNSFMGMPAAYIIASSSTNEETKPKVEKMLNEIKTVFIEEVEKLNWMDEKTKNITFTKSKKMLSYVGYPEWLFDNSTLEKEFENITISTDEYLKNLVVIIKDHYQGILKNLRKSNENVWDGTDPNEVNAYNDISKNSIYIPMGILSFPLFIPALEVLDYGSLGTTLGHELTHGFDNSGRRYGIYGDLMPWWSNKTTEAFEELTQCFVEQYSNFTIDRLDGQCDGNVSLGENIADNGGLRQAYTAYLKHYKKYGEEDKLPGFENFSSHQMFFIAYGSTWCEIMEDIVLQAEMATDHLPKLIRLHGTVQNSDAFAEAFNCPKGSKMNPDRPKCKLW